MAYRLFVIPGSHPSLSGRLMLERKGIPYKRVDLVPAMHRLVLKAARFPGVTVPALRLDDGRRVQGTLDIARTLDEIQPEPRLLPADPAERAKVEEIERWADENLQPIPRRLSWWGLRRDRSTMASYLEGARLGLPVSLAAKTGGPFAILAGRLNAATDENIRRDLEALPGIVNRIDELLEEGTLGSDAPTVADYQVATSLRLLLTFEDIRPWLDERPAGKFARRLVPDYPGTLPRSFPPELVPQPAGSASS